MPTIKCDTFMQINDLWSRFERRQIIYKAHLIYATQRVKVRQPSYRRRWWRINNGFIGMNDTPAGLCSHPLKNRGGTVNNIEKPNNFRFHDHTITICLWAITGFWAAAANQ